MKKLIPCILTAFLATVAISFAASGDKDTIISKEKAAWQAFKDKKADDFKKLLSADLVTVYADGIHNLQQEVDAMSKTDMKSFDLTDFNVVFPDTDTAIITYKAKIEATSDGKDVSGTYNVGSVWQLTNGQWKGVFHTDSKAMPPPTSPAG
ncbi:MAG TPA: nuclear transport factor 2 family protein [Candidatus Udaeobacter sp.]